MRRAWEAFSDLNGDLDRHAFMEGLRRGNLALYHRFLADHLNAVLPIVDTPTVGAAIQGFSRRYRSPLDGVFLHAGQRGRLRQVPRDSLPRPADLALVTDSEGILGIDDQGVGGIHICQGKLTVCTLCAGLNPERVLAVALDVGTNRDSCLRIRSIPACGDDVCRVMPTWPSSMRSWRPCVWNVLGPACTRRTSVPPMPASCWSGIASTFPASMTTSRAPAE